MDIHSTVTDLPLSCKSAAEHLSRELAAEDSCLDSAAANCHRYSRAKVGAAYASLPEECLQKLTRLEQDIEDQTGTKVALVAYRV